LPVFREKRKFTCTNPYTFKKAGASKLPFGSLLGFFKVTVDVVDVNRPSIGLGEDKIAVFF
jgi:hypothetical protein